MSTYARKDIAFTKGEGVWLWDENGNKYLDALSGIAVCGLGHAHPQVAETISKQSQTLIHTSNIYRITSQEQLGDRLCKISNMDRVFLCNSGAWCMLCGSVNCIRPLQSKAICASPK